MSSLVSFGYQESVSASVSSTKGLVTNTGNLSRSNALKLTNGTGASQADGVFTADTALAAGATDAYFLALGLQNSVNEPLEFASVKFVMVEADLSNKSPLILSGSWAGPFTDADRQATVGPGDILTWKTMGATGWPVDPNADEFLVTCMANALYRLTIVGVSSAISLPAAALEPQIIGPVSVGSLVYCTDGSFSGDPNFTYQWRLGGVVQPGFAAATCLPPQAWYGKALKRVTIAQNGAGRAVFETAPVIVGAAGPGAGAADLKLDNPGPGLAAVL